MGISSIKKFLICNNTVCFQCMIFHRYLISVQVIVLKREIERDREIETVGPDPMTVESLQGMGGEWIGSAFRSSRMKERKKKDSGGISKGRIK